MIASRFIVELRSKLDAAEWAWVASGLHQDFVIWSSLADTDLGWKALACFGDQAASWLPANLGLLVLDNPAPLAFFNALPLQPLGTSLKKRANQAYEMWRSLPGDTPLTLTQAVLLALSLREWRRLKGTWEGLPADFSGREPGIGTVLAVLYALAPDPYELLSSFLSSGQPAISPPIVLHAFLCNPQPTPSQTEILKPLVKGLSPTARLAALDYLIAQRPTLATELAQALANEPGMTGPASPASACDFSGALSSLEILERQWQDSELQRLAHRPQQAQAALSSALRLQTVLQADLHARLATVLNDTDPAIAMLHWAEAVCLDSGQPRFAAGLIEATLTNHDLPTAQSHLHTALSSVGASASPELHLAAARVQAEAGELRSANTSACQALELIQNNPHAASAQLAMRLAECLLQLNNPQAALQAGQIGLLTAPNHVELLACQVRAHLALGQPSEALGYAYQAYACGAQTGSATGNCLAGGYPIHQLLIDSLEAAGEWSRAYLERSQAIASLPAPKPEDWSAAARAALQAGQLPEAEQACRQALKINGEDGVSLGLLGEIALIQNDVATALSHLRGAVRVAAQDADLWIMLAGIYRHTGQAARALETLRSGSQAAPDAPEIFLALAEACLTENAPTQALPFLRRANELVEGEADLDQPAVTHQQRKRLALHNRVRYYLGRTLAQLGHLPEARAALASAYQSESQTNTLDSDLAYCYAQTLTALGEFTTALPVYASAVHTEPDSPAPYLEYGRALLNQPDRQPAQVALAIPVLRHVVQTARHTSSSPDQARRMTAEAQALLAEALLATGDACQAFDVFRSALDSELAREPGWNARLALGLSQAALESGQSEAALAALQIVAHSAPHDPELHRRRSAVYLELSLAAEALQAAQDACLYSGQDPAMLDWFSAQALRVALLPGADVGACQAAAVEALKIAVERLPSRTDLLVRLGNLYVGTGQITQAAITYRRLLSCPTPANTTELRLAAQGLLAVGEPQAAIPLLERAISALSTDAAQASNPQFRADLLCDLSLAQFQAGDALAAQQTIDLALHLNPNAAHFYEQKASQLHSLGQPEAAMECLEQGLCRCLDQASLRLHMAFYLHNLGRLPAALDQASQASQISQAANGAATSSPQPSEQMVGGMTGATATGTVPAEVISVVLAAHLSRAMLFPDTALQILRNAPVHPFSAPLQAEIAFQLGQVDEAARLLAMAKQGERTAPDSQERSDGELVHSAEINGRSTPVASVAAFVESTRQAQHARLLFRSPEGFTQLQPHERLAAAEQAFSAAKNTFRAARRNMAPTNFADTPEAVHLTPPGEARLYLLLALYSLCATAIELSKWEEAHALAVELVELAPLEPAAHLLLAETRLCGATQQRMAHLLDFERHAPGPDWLSSAASHELDTALKQASQIIKSYSVAVNQEFPPIALHAVTRLQQGAALIYNPGSPEVTDALEATLIAGSTGQHHDLAALLLACATLNPVPPAAGQPSTAWQEAAQSLVNHKILQPQLATYQGIFLRSRQPARARAVVEQALSQPDMLNPNDLAMLHAQQAGLLMTDIPSEANGQAPVAAATASLRAALASYRAALQIWPDEPQWLARAAALAWQLATSTIPPAAEAATFQVAQPRFSVGPIRLPPDEHQDKLQAGLDTQPDENLLEALEFQQRATELQPHLARTHLTLGQLLAQLGRYPEAAQEFETATHLAPDLPESWMALADAQSARKDLPAATASIEQALRCSEQQAHAAIRLPALLLAGEIALKASNPRQALTRIQTLLSLAPDHPAALHLLSRILEALNRPTEALAALEKAIRQVEDPLPLELERAHLLRRSEGLEFALQALQALAHHYPAEPGFLAPLAEGLMEAGQGEAAIQTARQALQTANGRLTDTEKADLYYLIGRQMHEAGQLDHAIQQLNETIQIAPAHLEAYLELGRVHQDRRQYGLALKIYQQAIDIDANDPRPYHYAAQALKENKDYLGAEAMLRRALELAPNDIAITRMLGIVVALNFIHNRRPIEQSR